MRLRIEADLPGLEDLLRKVEKEKLEPALRIIGEEVVNLVGEGFQQSRDPYGKPWEALSDNTLGSLVPGTKRRRSSYGTRPLVRRSTLMRSFNYQIVNDGVEVGTPYPYAKYHQGDGSESRVLPRRMMLPDADRGLPKNWQADIIGVVEEYLEGA